MSSQKHSNPNEIFIPKGRDIVQRSLVFRNTSGKDFVLKLIASHPSSIIFPTTVFRFPPSSYRTIQFRVNSKNKNSWEELHIKGFVLPIYSKNLKEWIDKKDVAGTPEQEAFKMTIKATDFFSAPHTVVNLPGKSACIESSDHPVDVEELDTYTAVNIDKDVATAEPIGSMMGFVEEYNKNKVNNSCWITNYICGKQEKKEDKSCKSKKSGKSKSCRSKSRYGRMNVCLEAAPCAGSTVQA